MKSFAALAVLVSISGCSGPPSTPVGPAGDVGTALDMTTAPPEDAGSDGDASAPDAARPWSIEPGCNPLAYRHDCFFPFPSDYFVDDATGLVRLTGPSRVQTSRGPVDPIGRRADGFPVHPQLVAYLSDGFAAQFPGPDAASSANPTFDSKTLLVDAESGVLVPHWAERFEGWNETEHRLLAVRPLVRLEEGKRYIVALRDLDDADEQPLEAPDGFRQMRDGELTGAPEWVRTYARRLERDVLEPLDELGVSRDRLVLAWDFTVESEESVTEDLDEVVALATAQMETISPGVRIDRIVESADLPDYLQATTERRIDGVIVPVPSYLDGGDGLRLRRDRDGRPTLSRNVEVPFTALISKTAAAATEPGRIIQFGHGLFGDRAEIVQNWQFRVADRLGAVIVAIDWWGFSGVDLTQFVQALTGDLTQAFAASDRLMQAFVNHLALERVIAETLWREPAFRVGSRPAYDPAQHYYLGVSGGGIFGGTLAAHAERLDRFVLNVGGASIGLILTRSDAFAAFNVLLRQTFGELGAHRVTALAPLGLARIDPVSWSGRLLQSDVRLLYQIGEADAAVPHLAGELAARAVNATVVEGSVRQPPFMPVSDSGFDGNGLAVVGFGTPASVGADWETIEEDTPAHEGVRRYAPMISMMDAFFAPDGLVEPTCEGPCQAP